MSIDRISEEYIRNWLGKKRRKPLILRGARQVGKSTLALRFDLNKPSSAVVRARARWGESVKDVEFELISLPLYAVEGAAAV